jgi:hypothetical protein
MDFEKIGLSRDLLYLTAVLLGTALGFFLTLFRKDMETRARNRRISLIFCILSGAVAVFALSLLNSRALILNESRFFVPSVVFALICALAVYFPRGAAFPLILVAGLLTVWIAYSFLRFPLIEENVTSLMSISHAEENRLAVYLPSNDGDRAEPVVYQVTGDSSSITFSAAVISFDWLYPIVGGENRGAITAIRKEGETIYTDLLLNRPSLIAYYSLFISETGKGRFGINYHTYQNSMPSAADGMKASLFFNKQDFFFK